nr:hypothetical protein [Bacteroidia bacterium]
MKNIYKSYYLVLTLFIALLTSTVSQAQIIVQVGTGTAASPNNGQPAPYGAWFSQSRYQVLILASELNALGLAGPANINALAMNVTNLNGAGAHQNFTIKVKQTTLTALTANFDNLNLTTVTNPVNYSVIPGWNTHTFNAPFLWDGTSNLLFDICHDNGNNNWSNSPQVEVSNTPFASVVQSWSDQLTGVMCPTGGAATTYTSRTNIRITANPVSTGPNPNLFPPIANFAYNKGIDTVWVNSPYAFVNNSIGDSANYWDIIGMTGTRTC